MRLLFLSNLFPDRSDPVRGLDNAMLLRNLAERDDLEIRVLALRSRLSLGRPGRLSLDPVPEDVRFTPVFESIRYVPRIGGSLWNDRLAEFDLADAFRRTIGEFQPDVVLCSWLFPDGCAASRLCQAHGVPLVLITQGSDTHVYLQKKTRRRKILKAIGRSHRVICRSGDLADRLAKAGAPREKLTVIYNGVDPRIFRADRDPIATRLELGIGKDDTAPHLLFVGNLLPVKAPHLLLHALAELNRRRESRGQTTARLILIGAGPLRKSLERETARLKQAHAVRFLGRRTPEEIAKWMTISRCLCLTSLNEGFPNVILEALSCGLPVVSTDVGGISEKITGPPRGRLTEPGNLPAFVEALEATLESETSQRSSENLSWHRAATEYAAQLQSALD